MAFVAIFAALTLAFAACLSLLAYAAPDMRFDGRALALNVVWSAVLAGLATLLLRGALSFLAGG